MLAALFTTLAGATETTAEPTQPTTETTEDTGKDMALGENMIRTDSPDQKATRINFTYSNLLIKNTIDDLVWAQFAEKSDLPKHAGTQTIRFRRRDSGKAEDVQKLKEGEVIKKSSTTKLFSVEVELQQFGDYVVLSDLRDDTDLFSQLDIEVERMGESAAMHFDTMIRNELFDTITTPISKDDPATVQAFSAQGGATSKEAIGCLTLADIERAKKILQINRAPRFGGNDGDYVCVLSHEGSYDIGQDPAWRRVREYQDKQKIYNGELGSNMGVRLVECGNPHRSKLVTDKKFVADAGGDIYTAFVFGKQAFATPQLAGSKSPHAPRFIFNNKSDKSDPLDQTITAGWKAMYAAKVLNAKNIVAIRFRTSFVG